MFGSGTSCRRPTPALPTEERSRRRSRETASLRHEPDPAQESSSRHPFSPEEKFMRILMRCFAAVLPPILPALSDAGGAPPDSTVTAFGTVAVCDGNDA